MSGRQLTICYQNVRGLNTKVTDFYNATSASTFHVLALTETWLDVNVNNAELFTSDYSVFRSDRQFTRLGLTRGGGVLLAIKSFLKSVQINLDSMLSNDIAAVDIVGVKVLLSGGALMIFCVYVPPRFSASQYTSLFNVLGSLPEIFTSNSYHHWGLQYSELCCSKFFPFAFWVCYGGT